MKSIALDILGRVISKPDDVNLRKLRATHPAIQVCVIDQLSRPLHAVHLLTMVHRVFVEQNYQ